MDRRTELELLEELASLGAAQSFFLDESIATSPVTRYTCPKRFERERQELFRGLPAIAAHSSELAARDSFLTRDLAGLPLLLTRDRGGAVHAFLNVCRHRGTRLVSEESGCRRRFSCPYHAWTYDNRGALLAIPHGDSGFPDLNLKALGLKRLGCQEVHGWIWVCAEKDIKIEVDGFLDGLAADFSWLNAGNLKKVHGDTIECAANWKILYEGGLEAYHFQTAHKNTIGLYFLDNLSSYRMFGRHIRSVLPRTRLDAEMALPEESRSLRRAANIVYSIFPSAQFLVQEDHLVWIQIQPLAVDRSRVCLVTLAPADTDTEAEHWRKNHEITSRTLSEDFAIGESIQSGLDSGANSELHFGRFEGALSKFNMIVESELSGKALPKQSRLNLNKN